MAYMFETEPGGPATAIEILVTRLGNNKIRKK